MSWAVLLFIFCFLLSAYDVCMYIYIFIENEYPHCAQNSCTSCNDSVFLLVIDTTSVSCTLTLTSTMGMVYRKHFTSQIVSWQFLSISTATCFFLAQVWPFFVFFFCFFVVLSLVFQVLNFCGIFIWWKWVYTN